MKEFASESKEATPHKMTVCPSWPHLWETSSLIDLWLNSLLSWMGNASNSHRNTVFGPVFCPLKTAIIPVSPMGWMISEGLDFFKKEITREDVLNSIPESSGFDVILVEIEWGAVWFLFWCVAVNCFLLVKCNWHTLFGFSDPFYDMLIS